MKQLKNRRIPVSLREFKQVSLKWYMPILFAIAFALSFVFPAIGGGALAVAFAPVISTDGLEGEEKQFMENLQKRFKKIDLNVLTKEEIQTEIKNVMNKFNDEMATKFSGLLDEKTGFAAMVDVLKAQGSEITSLKGSLAGNKYNRPETVREQVAKWAEANKAAIALAKAKQSTSLPGLEISKAAIDMTEAASLNSSAYLPNVQVMPGVIDLVRVQPTFWSRLTKGATKANPLVWVNKYNRQGNAVFTAEGVAKTQISFELKTETSVPRKIPAKTKISTEMLDDIDYIAGVIENELQYEIDKLSNSGVLTGDGVAPNPKGVTLYASAYTIATISGVINPNNADAIRAAVAQLRSLNFGGPLTAFINPIDAAQMDLEKNTQGSYVLPPFSTPDGRNIAATPVIEDNNIAVGYLLVGDMSKYHVLMYQDFTVSYGWENTDFTDNVVSIIAERRFHQYVSLNETAAFVYDTFENIKTALA